MLQQTQVATVVDYFQRFIKALPTLQDLAAASEDDVLRLWQGLGYYRRARHLQAAARCVADRHAGQIPQDVESLRALPGVGRYTAGAIASLAFGVRAPVVDGNVARVLARWFDIRRSIDDPKVIGSIWDAAAALVPARRPGRFNEALMELGALVCTPRQPQCPRCPVRAYCRSFLAGSVAHVPLRSPRRRPKAVVHHVAALVHRGCLVLEQRGDRGLWARMWQMPTFESMPEPVNTVAMQRRLREGGPCEVRKMDRVATFSHQTTHRTIRFHIWLVQLAGRRPAREGWIWRRIGRCGDDLPLAVPQRRALTMVAQTLATSKQRPSA